MLEKVGKSGSETKEICPKHNFFFFVNYSYSGNIDFIAQVNGEFALKHVGILIC